MERVGELIDKLKKQFEENPEAAEKLLVTVQLLLSEIQQHPQCISQGNVSITNTSESLNIKPAITRHQVKPKKEEHSGWLFDPIESIPTLALQEKKNEVFELNDILTEEKEESVNEKLKEEKTEIGSVLKESPVKDLKRAIGINDKYVFINELLKEALKLSTLLQFLPKPNSGFSAN